MVSEFLLCTTEVVQEGLAGSGTCFKRYCALQLQASRFAWQMGPLNWCHFTSNFRVVFTRSVCRWSVTGRVQSYSTKLQVWPFWIWKSVGKHIGMSKPPTDLPSTTTVSFVCPEAYGCRSLIWCSGLMQLWLGLNAKCLGMRCICQNKYVIEIPGHHLVDTPMIQTSNLLFQTRI